jgi:hypothetical protein
MVNRKKINFQNEVLNFGLDHLEVYGIFKHEKELFDVLDFDNSNYWELEDFTFTKTEVPKFEYKVIFTKDNYSVFAYYKWKPKSKRQPVGTRDYIVVYSTAFKLMEIKEIQYFLEWYFDLSHCRRFDICMDFKKDIQKILKYFKDFKTETNFKKKWKIETRYIWEVKNTLNKRQIIRVYDKLKDLIVKKKVNLYSWYFDYKETGVTRIELEIRQELAKNIEYYVLLHNQDKLFWIFKNYVWKHTELLNFIEVEKISLYKEPEKIDPEKYQSLYYRTQRKNLFVWHAKTIFNMWFCPIRVLISEWLIQENTIKLIWIRNFEELLQRELKIRREEKEDKNMSENLHEILNNLYKYGRV